MEENVKHRFSWSHPSQSSHPSRPEVPRSHGQIQQAGDVKKDWSELISQLLTYMRAMRSAFPEGLFRIGYALNQKTSEIRVVIHHNGGITVCEALDIRKKEDRIQLQKILFSMFCWQNAEDAGFTALTDGITYNIPLSGLWTHHSTLFRNHCGRGRGTRVVKVVRQDQVAADDPIEREASITLSKAPPFVGNYASCSSRDFCPSLICSLLRVR